MTRKELRSFYKNIGKTTTLKGFTSSSQSLEKAIHFANKFNRKLKKNKNKIPVLFMIDLKNESAKNYVDMIGCSLYPSELEILLSDGLIYKVISVDYTDENF